MSFTYRGLQAELQRHIVTDEEIQKQLERILQQNPKIQVVTDRAAQLGDEVILDYAGFCDGEQFAGGTAQNQTLVLGSGMFIPGFEEQLLDKVPGEEVVVNVTFPEQYHSEALAGKQAQFHCKIHSIRVKTPYELDDVFAKEVGECDTLEQMRQRMLEAMQAYADDQGEMDLQERLMRQVAESLEITISDRMLEEAVEEQLHNLGAQLAQQGLNLDMYCQFMSTTVDKLREDLRPQAEFTIRSRAAVDEIVQIEGLEATKEDIGQALALVARQNNITLDQLKEQYDAALEQAIINSILAGKVMQVVRSAAIVEE
jgi:trigger factor